MRLARAGALVFLVAATLVILVRASAVRGAPERVVSDSARRLVEIDAKLDRAVLESRAGLSLNYDEAMATVLELTSVEQELEAAAGEIDDETLEAEIAAARARAKNRASLVEAFQSLNSVFRSSATFLPVAAKQATTLGERGEPFERARRGVTDLLEDVFACRAGCGEEAMNEVAADIGALEKATVALPAPERGPFEVVLRHARIVRAFGPELESTVRALVRMDGHEYTEIAETVRLRNERALRRATAYRSGLGALSVALVVALLVAARRVRRTAVALLHERRVLAEKQFELATLNQELESRVLRRTEALSESRDQYRLLAETTQAIPFEIDPTTLSLRYLGPQATAVLGFGPAEWGKPGFLASHIHAEDRAAAFAGLAGNTSEGEELEFRILASGGRWVWLRAFLSSVSEDTETVRRGVFLDATARRDLEAKLRGAQKLEAVGRLASGIAHEINTPVQFVSDNVHFVADAVRTLVAVLTTYRAAHHDPVLRRREEVDDVDFLIDDVPRALIASQEGLDRIANIVRAMKGFAHPDRIGKSAANLNVNIMNTLTIARSEYMSVAEVKTELEDLPPVCCHAGEINQVLLNLVTNAAHAIGEVVSATGQLGQITVRSWREGTDVVVSVKDTGAGVPLEHRENLFDPFFTTKEVGVGTGQGLAIARSLVVDKHGGEITFESVLGRGTEFRVRLPIDGGEPTAAPSFPLSLA